MTDLERLKAERDAARAAYDAARAAHDAARDAYDASHDAAHDAARDAARDAYAAWVAALTYFDADAAYNAALAAQPKEPTDD